jgi:hypothetical protein
MKITKPKWLKNFIIRYNNIDKSNRFFVNVGFVWTAVVLFLFVPNTLIDVYVSENGNLVNANIAEMPSCCDCKYMYASFEINKKEFIKRVWRSFCSDYKSGENIPFYYLENFPNNAIFKIHQGDEVKSQFISSVLLLMFGVFVIVYSFKN